MRYRVEWDRAIYRYYSLNAETGEERIGTLETKPDWVDYGRSFFFLRRAAAFAARRAIHPRSSTGGWRVVRIRDGAEMLVMFKPRAEEDFLRSYAQAINSAVNLRTIAEARR